MPIINVLNSVFFCQALTIKRQITCGNVLHTSKTKIHIKALYEEPTVFWEEHFTHEAYILGFNGRIGTFLLHNNTFQ